MTGDSAPDPDIDIAHPEFVPDASLSREEMEDQQRAIADAAVFADDLPFDPAAVSLEGGTLTGEEPPVVVGVDQSFLDDRAISAVVAMRGGEVVEKTHAVTPLEIPYIPGLLAFREGGPILDAFATLSVDPDLAVFDGSGRLHFRQAGIATHIGVLLDLPAVGVAKSQLCGDLEEPAGGRPEGWRTPIRAGDRVEAEPGTILGYAYQSRQWARSQSINPLYVSPGHRVSAETTVDLVESLVGDYKLPEPTRLADQHADDVKAEYE